MISTSIPNEYSAISNENKEITYEEFDHLITKYNIPFTQTSFSRLDLSIFTSKLRELSENKNELDDKAIIKKNWLLLIKNYLLIQRLNDILDHFLKVKSGGQLFLQKKFFHQWANKTVNHSNKEKWIRIASLVRQINWRKKAHDQSSRLDKQRVDLAAKYLISQKEYQNPQYNFFIRKALPIITDKQKKILEEELEEDRQTVMMFDNSNSQNEKVSANDSSENSFKQNNEVFNRDIVLTPPQSPSDFTPNSTPKRKKGDLLKNHLKMKQRIILLHQ